MWEVTDAVTYLFQQFVWMILIALFFAFNLYLSDKKIDLVFLKLSVHLECKHWTLK